jgi:hypothetical protein
VKVRIAFATDTDGNPDVARIGTVEDHPDADAKELIKQGIAAAATEQDVADWEAGEAHRKQVADAETASRIESSDLNSLTMDQLREQYPAAAEQPSSAKKADLIAAVEEAQASGTKADEQPTDPRKQRRNRVSGQLEDLGYAEGGVIAESGSAGDDRVPVALGSHPPIVTVAPGAESSPDVDPADRDK